METVLPALALLACPVGMGLMMWVMSRGTPGRDRGEQRSAAQLRAEQERLSREIARLEQEQQPRAQRFAESQS
jgi:hypothetical protein